MINLLSDDKKAEIKAGRVNVILLRFITIASGGIVLLAFIVVGAYVTLSYTNTQANSHVQQSAKDEANYATTISQAQTYRDNLATAKQILDQETNYSSLILKIANTIPSGVIIDTLSLDAKTIGQPTTLTAHAKNLAAAEALKESLIKHSELYSNVSFTQIDNGASSNGDTGLSGYPVTVSLSLTINKASLQQ